MPTFVRKVGNNWSKSDNKSFPIKSVNDLELCNEEKKILDDESLVTGTDCISNYSNSFVVLSEEISNNLDKRYSPMLY